jgi:hypothetical protein
MSHKLTVNEAIKIREILNLFSSLGGIDKCCTDLANNVKYLGSAICVSETEGKKQPYLCVPLGYRVTVAEMVALFNIVPRNSEIGYGEDLEMFGDTYLRIPITSDDAGKFQLKDLVTLRTLLDSRLKTSATYSATYAEGLKNGLVALNNSSN